MLTKESNRVRRHHRIRKKLQGTPDRPRLTVHRSLKNLYVQVVDDIAEKTLVSFSTQHKEFKTAKKAKKVEKSSELGKFFAGKLKEKGIKKVAFDRGGYQYHGRVKALAESLRQAGIEF